MFSSPCSLRSAQCATLIALAAAAGIARVPTTPKRPTTETAVPLAASHVATPSRVVSTFVVVHPNVTPWQRPTIVALAAPAIPVANDEILIHPSVMAPEGSRSFGSISLLEKQSERFLVSLAVVGSEGAHRLPFAVGPPVRGINGYVVSVVSRRARIARHSVRAQRGKESVKSGFSPCAANHPSAQAEFSQKQFTGRPAASAPALCLQRRTERAASSSAILP